MPAIGGFIIVHSGNKLLSSQKETNTMHFLDISCGFLNPLIGLPAWPPFTVRIPLLWRRKRWWRKTQLMPSCRCLSQNTYTGKGFFKDCIHPLAPSFFFFSYFYCPRLQLVACQVWNMTGARNPNLFASLSLQMQILVVSHQVELPMGLRMGLHTELHMGQTAMDTGMAMGMDIMGQLAARQVVTAVVVADMAYPMRPNLPSFIWGRALCNRRRPSWISERPFGNWQQNWLSVRALGEDIMMTAIMGLHITTPSIPHTPLTATMLTHISL